MYVGFSTQNNELVIGYYMGAFSWVRPALNQTSLIKQFTCKKGLPSVDSVQLKIYHVEMCSEPVIKTISFSNVTEASVTLDPALATSVSLQSGSLYTPYGCGATCGTHPDCGKSNSCGICRVGKCVASGECGAFCTGPLDCYAGVCVGDCEDGRCGKAGCGATCKNFDDCTSSRTCKICRLGSCVADGECGSYCLTPLDCYGGECVNNCVNFQCTKK